MADEVAAAREKLIEAAADVDDAIASAFLEGQALDEAQLKAALRKATIECKIVPVLAGAALRNKGVQPLLDAVCDYLPSPLEVPPVAGVVPGSEEPTTRPPDDTAPFCALAFKVAMHEGRKAVYLRIYSGVLTPGRRGPQRAHAHATRRWRGCSRCTPTAASGSSARAPAASSSRPGSRTRAPATRWRRPRRPSSSSASTSTSR